MADICIVFNAPSGLLVKVTAKGLKTLQNCSKKKNDQDIYDALVASAQNNNTVFVHEYCRKSYTDKRKFSEDKQERKSTKSHASIDLKSNCIYCNETCISDPKNPSQKDWHLISTKKKKETILDACSQRISCDSTDGWALDVKARVNACIDLVATKAKYHMRCRMEFELGNPQNSCIKGRKPSSKHMDSFKEACRWLEQESKVHTVKEFREKIQEYLGEVKAYKQ